MMLELFENFDELLPLFCVFLLLFLVGFVSCWFVQRTRLRTHHQLGAQILEQAEQEALALRQRTEVENQQKSLEYRRQWGEELRVEQRKIEREQARLEEREDKLESRMLAVDKKLALLERKEESVGKLNEQCQDALDTVRKQEQALVQQLERLAGLTQAQARDQLLARLENELRVETTTRLLQAENEIERQSDHLAKQAVATAIGRLAVSCVSEGTVTTVAIPSEEMKARIIGREGRNIRHLERLTGVNFLIDDTPGAVVLSAFDPMRKQVAKMALTELVKDGRIHPTRIEEAVDKARADLEQQTRRFGEEAAMRAGVLGLHKDLIYYLGKLKFRTSYAQNVLEHSLEVSHLLGLMAAELGLDQALAKRIGLLHDIGKALSQEVEGSHAIVGYELALKCGESPEVAHGIGCHHGEMPPTTIEGSLCGAADALSAARPGARVEAMEEYLKRLKHLEDIASRFPGICQAYAMQAGREIHVSVIPDVIDDEGTLALSREIARAIEKELSYPGKIKVTAIREKRCIQYAL
jgi:ribonuclease Y